VPIRSSKVAQVPSAEASQTDAKNNLNGPIVDSQQSEDQAVGPPSLASCGSESTVTSSTTTTNDLDRSAIETKIDKYRPRSLVDISSLQDLSATHRCKLVCLNFRIAHANIGPLISIWDDAYQSLFEEAVYGDYFLDWISSGCGHRLLKCMDEVLANYRRWQSEVEQARKDNPSLRDHWQDFDARIAAVDKPDFSRLEEQLRRFATRMDQGRRCEGPKFNPRRDSAIEASQNTSAGHDETATESPLSAATGSSGTIHGGDDILPRSTPDLDNSELELAQENSPSQGFACQGKNRLSIQNRDIGELGTAFWPSKPVTQSRGANTPVAKDSLRLKSHRLRDSSSGTKNNTPPNSKTSLPDFGRANTITDPGKTAAFGVEDRRTKMATQPTNLKKLHRTVQIRGPSRYTSTSQAEDATHPKTSPPSETATEDAQCHAASLSRLPRPVPGRFPKTPSPHASPLSYKSSRLPRLKPSPLRTSCHHRIEGAERQHSVEERNEEKEGRKGTARDSSVYYSATESACDLETGSADGEIGCAY
jgi:hypothetical protein